MVSHIFDTLHIVIIIMSIHWVFYMDYDPYMEVSNIE